MPKRWHVDDDLLRALAATSDAAREIIEREIRSKRRGRPAAPEGDYRELRFRWRGFRKLNSNLTEDQALRKFLRICGREIETALGLKRNTAESLRKAIARGAKETERIGQRRRRDWKILPAVSLADTVHGRQHVLSTNPYLRAAAEAALLGTLGAGPLFDPFKVR